MKMEKSTDNTEIQSLVRDYCQQLYANKMNNLEEMDKFLKYNLPKVNQEQIQNLNRTIRSMEIKTVIKKIFQQANSQDQIASQMNSTKNFVSQFSRSAVSNSLRPHRLQHARPPYPSPTPGACSDSCPVFSNESVLPIKWPKYWNFSFSISPS